MSCIEIREFIRLVIKENADALDSAQILSQYAHRGQKRRSGEPYFLHPQEVGDIVKRYYSDIETYYTALLHDAIEDGIPLGNIDDEAAFFDMLMEELPDANLTTIEKIYNSVVDLTRDQGLDYFSYILLLVKNPIALRVKLADIMQNIGDNPSNKQLEKYAKAKNLLLQKFNQAPTGISKEHWNDFQDEVKEAAGQ